MSKQSKRGYSEEEKAAKRAEDRERLVEAAQALLSTEGWLRWVKARGAFHKYSLSNTLLIALQRPDATRVAGFKTWKTLGRSVRKGEKGIRILAPISVKTRDEDADGDEQRRTFFRSVAVFDVAQTDPIEGATQAPLSPPSAPITGDSHAHLLPRLEAHAQTLGFTVTYEKINGNAAGYCDSGSRRIAVEIDQPANAKVRVLVHEIAHAHGVTYKTHTRAAAEVIVDTATYVACASLGLDTSGESIPYIAGWGEDGALEAAQAAAERIDEIARAIEEAASSATATSIAPAAAPAAAAGELAEAVAA
ncbi:MAG: ssDNA-binding domain-containing protein [Chloroflexi bacterium]|nr:ssDNA-binding domain-containing protein [Chloroflexota bacterium]